MSTYVTSIPPFSPTDLHMPLTLPHIHDFFIIMYMHVYTHIHAHTRTCLLSSFSVTHMCICLGMTTWDWVAHPWRKLILPLSAAISCL